MDNGRKAEELIKEMMIELGFKVVRYGYEYLLPQLANPQKLLKGQAGEFVRNMPDFLIVDKETNFAFLIEIKCSHYGELNENYRADFPETYIILVSPNEITIASNEYIMENPDNKNPFQLLTEIGPFRDKDKSIIMKYVKKTKEIFSN